jgi:HEAT repeat protein
MAGRSIDDQLARIATLAKGSASAEAIAELSKALSGKSNVLAAAAANALGVLGARTLAPQLVSTFPRFMADGADKGCLAKTAIVKALVAMEVEDEPTFLAGASHVQREPSYGGSGDAALELRCESVSALVRMNSRKMWEPLVNLLAESDVQARATAARALGATGHDHAALLVRYKIRIGDPEPGVMGECFGAILRLTRSIELVEPFLDSSDSDLFEAAALALGESRLPAAWAVLKKRSARTFDDESRRVLLLAIAMTRQSEAIDFLIERLQSAKDFDNALEALAMYRSDSAIRGRIDSAVPAKLAAVKARLG